MASSSSNAAFGGRNNPVVVNEDDDSENDNTIIPDELEEEEFALRAAFIIDTDLKGPASHTHASRGLLSYRYAGLALSLGTTVELSDGNFLLVSRIPQRQDTREVFLEGQIFRRTCQLEGLLEKKKNEVAWLQKYKPNVDGDTYRQSLQRVEMSRVVRVRELVLTNQFYPTASYRDDHANARLTKAEILQNCRLACRWKYLSSGSKEGSLLALSEDETDAWYRSPSSVLKYTCRGVSAKGGSCPDWLAGERDFDKAERVRCNDLDLLGFRQPKDHLEESGKRYTFGDGFCGAGGVSRGAKAAGLRVLWGFDFNKAAIDSYRSNFHETMCWCCPADTFVTAILDDVKVDVLHLSPPCQPYSPIHVQAGRNDDANEASFFALEGILRKVKPRVAMVEETFGLLRTADRMQWFHAMIQIFTKTGYSVRWRIFNLLDFGVPGRRQRLFLFASW